MKRGVSMQLIMLSKSLRRGDSEFATGAGFVLLAGRQSKEVMPYANLHFSPGTPQNVTPITIAH